MSRLLIRLDTPAGALQIVIRKVGRNRQDVWDWEEMVDGKVERQGYNYPSRAKAMDAAMARVMARYNEWHGTMGTGEEE